MDLTGYFHPYSLGYSITELLSINRPLYITINSNYLTIDNINRFILGIDEFRLPSNKIPYFSYLKAGGFGFHIEDSINSYFGEFLERISLYIPDLNNVEVFTEKFLESKGYNVVKIKDLVNSKHAIFIRGDIVDYNTIREVEIPYIRGKSFPLGDTIYIPVYSVYFNHNFIEKKINKSILKFINFLTTSNGVAAGPSLEFALSRSILEIIERHDFIMLWLTSSALEPIGIYKLPDLTLYVGKYTTLRGDYNSIFTIFLRKKEPMFGIGGATDYNIERSIIRSIKEGLAGYHALLSYYKNFYNKIDINKLKKFNNFDNNVVYYSLSNGYSEIRHIIDNILIKFSSISSRYYLDLIDLIEENSRYESNYSIYYIEKLIKANNLTFIITEIPSIIKGIKIYRALSLELLPLPIPEYTWYLADHKFIIENKINVSNTLPHPYP
ncbi:MAG: YcaO-like family protein [Saccharolobus sp.]|uniref:YcaO-like family protein n=1 Tax=Thermoprotei TaxID=183924 RepID=UPI003168B11B